MIEVPVYPCWARVTELPASALEAALPPTVMASDYQWLSLKAWNPAACLSRLDGALVVDFTDYHDPSRRLLGFAGGNCPSDIAAELLGHLRADSRAPELHLVDESAVAGLTNDFVCVPERDHADYVFSTADLATLAGSSHQKARHEIRRFERDLGAVARISTASAQTAPWAEMIELTEKWAANSARPDDARDEVEALRRCAAATASSGACERVTVTLLNLDDVPVGFDVTEITRMGWALLHFRHTPRELLGSYSFLRREAAKALAAKRVLELNAEQDLGVSGLRLRKMRDRPTRFVRKYRVRER